MQWSRLDCHVTKHPRKCTGTRRNFIELVLTPAPLKVHLFERSLELWKEKGSVPREEPTKKHYCGAVSPNLPAKGQIRSKEKGSGAWFLGFDFDHLSNEYRDWNCQALERNGVLAVARTTTSHAKKAVQGESRCRFMILLNRALNDWIEYDRLLAWGSEFLDGTPDPACEHSASLFYLPLKGVAEKKEWCWVNLDGQPLDVDFVLSMYPVGKKGAARRERQYHGEFQETTVEEHEIYWASCSQEKRDFLLSRCDAILNNPHVRWAILLDEGGNGRHDQSLEVLRLANDWGIPLRVWMPHVLESDWNKEQRFPLTREYIDSRHQTTAYDNCKTTFASRGESEWERELVFRKCVIR